VTGLSFAKIKESLACLALNLVFLSFREENNKKCVFFSRKMVRRIVISPKANDMLIAISPFRELLKDEMPSWRYAQIESANRL